MPRLFLLLFTLFFYSAVWGRATSCDGVDWRSSSQAQIDACLAQSPCAGITNNSNVTAITRCGNVLPCEVANVNDSYAKQCADYNTAQANDVFSDIQGFAPLPASVDQNGNLVSNANSSSYNLVLNNPSNPSDSSTATLNETEMLGRNAAGQDTDLISDTYNREDNLLERGTSLIDSYSTGSADEAQAYQTVMSIRNENPPLPINESDPMFNSGFSEVGRANDGAGEWFTSCSTTTVTNQQNLSHTPTTSHQCFTKNTDNFHTGRCDVQRELLYPFTNINSYGGWNAVPQSCGRSCLRFRIESEDNALDPGGAACRIFTSGFDIELGRDLTLASATIDSGNVDDWARIYVNGSMVATNGGDWASFASGGGCESGRNESFINGLSITSQVRRNISNNKAINMSFETAVGGKGEANYTITFRFNEDLGIEQNIISEEPLNCYTNLGPEFQEHSARNPAPPLDPGCINPCLCGDSPAPPAPPIPGYDREGFCQARNWSCFGTQSSPAPGYSGSIPGLFPGGDPLCVNARADFYTCDPFYDDSTEDDDIICFSDPTYDEHGNEIDPGICYEAGEIRDLEAASCEEFEDNPQCYPVSTDCEEGYEDPISKECYVRKTNYECQDDAESLVVEQSYEQNNCTGSFHCVGGDCVDNSEETNQDFAMAAGQFGALESIGNNAECEDPTDPGSCAVFNGDYEYCSFYPLNINDCCEPMDGGPSPAEYLTLIKQSARYEAKLAQSDLLTGTVYDSFRSEVSGQWDSLSEPITDGANTAFEWIKKPLTDAWSNLAGNAGEQITDSATGEASSIFDGFGFDQLKQEALNNLRDVLPADLQGAIFQETSLAAGKDAVLNDTILNAFEFINTIYSIYTAYQMAKLVLEILTACDENEQDVGLKLATKQCIRVNRSIHNSDGPTCEKKILGVCLKRQHHQCCYNSPLIRIIMEQGTAQIGKTIEVNRDDMTCKGLTFDELAQIDFSRIDMTEWLTMMNGAGLFPNESTTTEENLTGSGSDFAHGSRLSTTDRVQQNAADVELEQRRREAQQHIELFNIDCTIDNPPDVCAYNNGG